MLLFFFKKTRSISFLLLVCLLFILRAQTSFPKNHIKNILSQQAIIRENITFRIHDILKVKDDFYRYEIELLFLEQYQITGNVYWNTEKYYPIGNTYSGLLEIAKIEGVTNPNQFDYAEYSERNHIFGTATLHTSATLLKQESWHYKRTLFNLRKALLTRVRKRFPNHHEFVAAVLFAEREYQSDRVKKIQQSGLQHLLAVSGLHVGIITLILVNILNAFIQNKKIVYSFTLVLLFIYGFLCLWQASVMRAVCMLTILYIGKILEKPIFNLRVLFLSFYVLLFIHPNNIYSIGFQLSFLAVYILLSFLPFFNKQLNKKIVINKEKHSKKQIKIRKFARYLCLFFITTTLLSFGLAPITIYYFQEFNLNGLIANFVGIPMMGILLPAMIFILIIPEFLITFYHNAFYFMMETFDLWISWTSTLPFRHRFVTFNEMQFILGIALVTTSSFLFQKKLKKVRFLPLVFALCFFLSFFIHTENSNAYITFFDCGLGDLILIEANSKTMLVDCGPGIKEKKSFKNAALPYLKRNGIQKIDNLIITHGHLDHYGGLPELFEAVQVDSAFVTPHFFAQNIIQKQEKLFPLKRVKQVVAPYKIEWENALFEFIHPDSNYYDENKNNMSIVIRFSYNDFEVLLTGDLEEDGEDYLLERNPKVLDCDILKIGHHGSSSSTDLDFLDATSPEYAIISTSEKNRFHFPHKQTLKRLSAYRENLLITGKDGAIQIETDGKSAIFRTMKTNRFFIDTSL